MNILIKIDKILIEKGLNTEDRRVRLVGALYALSELGIVKKFHVKPIKQQKA